MGVPFLFIEDKLVTNIHNQLMHDNSIKDNPKYPPKQQLEYSLK